MTVKRPRSAAAFTLIEVMAAIIILAVAVLGTSGYRYYAALDARRANMQATAARIGLLLCESWRGIIDPNTFDAKQYFEDSFAEDELKFVIYDIPQTPEAWGSFGVFGCYEIVADGDYYYAILSWKDVDTGLKALNVAVVWSPRHQQPDGFAYIGARSTLADLGYNSFELTTYRSD